jgi:hypothetical protein
VMNGPVFYLTAMLAGSVVADGAAESPPKAITHCFSSAQFDGWRAADSTTLYIRANIDRIYRIDLTRACVTLTAPDAQLVLDIHGGSTICAATDIGLRVTQPFVSIPEPCFAKSMTELSSAEAAALPHALRP